MKDSEVLKGKKVLFLGPLLYEYYLYIIEELRNKGADVVFFPVKKKNSLTTILQNISKSLYEKYQNIYRRKILKKTENALFDYVLVIQPYLLSIDFFKNLKGEQKKAIFINYNWDSTNDYPIARFIHLFDKVFSFDPSDTAKYNMNYLPLFFIKKYEHISNVNRNKEIDVLFIGSYKKERYQFLKHMEKQFNNDNIKSYFYIKMSFNQYFKNYLMKGKIIRGIKFRTLKSDQIASLILKSKCMIDFPKVTQDGLTMRTFETLGGGLKLITTNKTILKEKVLQKNILVVDPDDPMISLEFVKSQFIKDDLISKYSLSNWILKVFSF